MSNSTARPSAVTKLHVAREMLAMTRNYYRNKSTFNPSRSHGSSVVPRLSFNDSVMTLRMKRAALAPVVIIMATVVVLMTIIAAVVVIVIGDLDRYRHRLHHRHHHHDHHLGRRRDHCFS